MNISDIKLTCIKRKGIKGWTVYTKQISGLIVQVDRLEDAPTEIAKSFEVMMKYGFDRKLHEIYKT